MSVVERSGTDGGSTELAITSYAAVTSLLHIMLAASLQDVDI